ncbi:MAG: cytochrome bc1 complex Rieske iron-sulfur subunit [Sporichthyaceae bacterium]
MSDAHGQDPRGEHSQELVANPFADPGLPHHTPRRTDTDARAAARAERQVAALFSLASLLTVAFVVAFVAIDKEEIINVVGIGRTNALNFALGLTLGGAMLCVGIGAIHWSRKLMNAEEMVQERHPMKSSPEDTAEVLQMAKAGVADSAIPRRKLIWASLVPALALLPIAPLITLRDLGPLPQKKLRETLFANPKHREIVRANGEKRIRPEDLQIGSLISAKPNDLESLDDLAKAAIMLVRMRPEEIRSKEQRDRGYQGIVAFSKICAHAGCPLGLYEQSTHHMLCPCHQTTFDLADFGKVIFGPGARNLPTLRIGVDDEGFLIALGDFDEPVGPSFWERG